MRCALQLEPFVVSHAPMKQRAAIHTRNDTTLYERAVCVRRQNVANPQQALLNMHSFTFVMLNGNSSRFFIICDNYLLIRQRQLTTSKAKRVYANVGSCVAVFGSRSVQSFLCVHVFVRRRRRWHPHRERFSRICIYEQQRNQPLPHGQCVSVDQKKWVSSFKFSLRLPSCLSERTL